MRQSFSCPYCKTLVIPEKSHYACRRTCGSPECQKQLNDDHIKRSDQLRQKQKIQQLKSQGIDLVTCQICKEEFEMIHHAHLKMHGLTVAEYRDKFPNYPILNSRIHQIKSQTLISRSRYLSYDAKPIDSNLYEFFTGTLLGDGYIDKHKKNARYAEGGANQAYMEWKHDFLKQYFSCTFQERLSSPHSKTGKQYRAWWLRTKVHPMLTELYFQWYFPEKKVFREMVEKYLTDFALSIWFYDDGCSNNGYFFYSHDFPKNDVHFLSNILESRFQLKNSVLQNQNNQYFIRISNYSRERLNAILNKYPIAGMEYKRKFN